MLAGFRVYGGTPMNSNDSAAPDNLEQLRAMAEKWNEAKAQHPCQSCGYCPHCGRGGHQMVPAYPVYPKPWYPAYLSPWYEVPRITWTVTSQTLC